MRTLNRVTEEFVRQYRLLIERTGDDPGKLAGALDENPELARSIVRLYEIQQQFEQRGGRRPFVVQADPNFRRAVKDFPDRWAGAYDEFRVRNYNQAAVRVSEEFMRCYGLLVERTGNDPAAVESVRKEQAELDGAIERLREIDYALGEPQGYGRRTWQFAAKAQEISRLLADASREFGAARADFQSRRADACAMSERPNPLLLLGGEEPLPTTIRVQRSPRDLSSDWLEQLLDSLPDAPIAEDASGGPARPFDPSRDSAAAVIDWAEDVLLEQFDREGWFSEQFDGSRRGAGTGLAGI